MSIAYDFTKSPSELVEYLKSKGLQTTFNYEEMLHEAHQKAFTVAKVTKLDLLSDIHSSLRDALKEGKPFSQWQDEIRPTLEKKGWWGEVEAIDPKTGEVKEIFVGSRRLKTIYDTNMRTAYAKGRYESQMDSDAEYLYYASLLEGNRRPLHKAKHGTLLPKTDPWWDTNYPPNGWGCKCKVRSYTKQEVLKRGLKVSQRPENIADKDWAYNPGKVDNALKAYEEKVKSLKCKSENAKNKSVDCGFLEEVKNVFKEDVKALALSAILFKEVQSLFVEPNKKLELCKSDIFGEQKRVILSSDTIDTHKVKHPEVNAFDYSLIPHIIIGRAFKQKENTYVVIEKFGKYYRVALKDVKDKDEIFVVSLVAANKKDDYERWIRELDKFEEIERSKR